MTSHMLWHHPGCNSSWWTAGGSRDSDCVELLQTSDGLNIVQDRGRGPGQTVTRRAVLTPCCGSEGPEPQMNLWELWIWILSWFLWQITKWNTKRIIQKQVVVEIQTEELLVHILLSCCSDQADEDLNGNFHSSLLVSWYQDLCRLYGNIDHWMSSGCVQAQSCRLSDIITVSRCSSTWWCIQGHWLKIQTCHPVACDSWGPWTHHIICPSCRLRWVRPGPEVCLDLAQISLSEPAAV